jgi:hypothetical protein
MVMESLVPVTLDDLVEIKVEPLVSRDYPPSNKVRILAATYEEVGLTTTHDVITPTLDTR